MNHISICEVSNAFVSFEFNGKSRIDVSQKYPLNRRRLGASALFGDNHDLSGVCDWTKLAGAFSARYQTNQCKCRRIQQKYALLLGLKQNVQAPREHRKSAQALFAALTAKTCPRIREEEEAIRIGILDFLRSPPSLPRRVFAAAARVRALLRIVIVGEVEGAVAPGFIARNLRWLCRLARNKAALRLVA